MVRKIHWHLTMLLLAAMLVTLIAASRDQVKAAATQAPFSINSTAVPEPSTTSTPPGSPQLPTPPSLLIPPAANPHIPSLRLDFDLSPNPIAVGDTATITVRVTNQAPDAAQNLTISLPLPTGAVALPSNAQSFAWNVPSLAGNTGFTLTGQLHLNQLPAGSTLLLRPQLTANGVAALTRSGGAIVVDRNLAPATARFTSGTATTLQSQDSQVEVNVPAGLFTSSLNLRHSIQPDAGFIPPTTIAGFHKGFGSFYLAARDDQNNSIHQFAQPLTITVSYTPQQLQALNISEQDLTLFWYDESSSRWVALPTTVDPSNRKASAKVNHFSTFQLGDGSSPSEAFIPSLQGFQVGLYSGDASYSMPIEVPAGPAGLKPDLALSYNSAATDGVAGQKAQAQAPWVGKGWSLDSGSIALNIQYQDYRAIRGYYSMVLNGQSFDLVRGDCVSANPCGKELHNNNEDLTTWEWHATNEAFMKVQVVSQAASDPSQGGRGGSLTLYGTGNTYPYGRYKWQIWTKDGTMYEYSEDLWWGWQEPNCDNHWAQMNTYKWLLTKVQDTHGNSVNYNYSRSGTNATQWFKDACNVITGTMDNDAWLTQVTWGSSGNQRYKVDFASSERKIDTNSEPRGDNRIGIGPFESRQLDTIKVSSMPTSTWNLVREYDLGYAAPSNSMFSDYWACLTQLCVPGTPGSWKPDPTRKLTLASVIHKGNDGVTAVPTTTFTYDITPGDGSSPYPKASWNRLTSADNGYGGKVAFSYASVGAVEGTTLFVNNRRIISKKLYNGQLDSAAQPINYTWNYSYTHPAVNWRGHSNDGQGAEPPNSARLVYAYWDGYPEKLARHDAGEFRGHRLVTETNPLGYQTEHYFYQGDPSDVMLSGGTFCNYYFTSPVDPCYLPLREREFLVGREWRTVARGTAGSNPLSEVKHYSTAAVIDVGIHDPNGADSGLWHAFSYDRQMVDTTLDPTSGVAKSKITNYEYITQTATSGGNGKWYGNLSKVEERGNNNELLRTTAYTYTVRDDITNSTYIVDRVNEEAIFDVQGRHLALTLYSYDHVLDNRVLGTTGDLTLVRKPYDLPKQTNIDFIDVHTNDTSYDYDAYGNRKSVTTYTTPGYFHRTVNYPNPGDPYFWSQSYVGGMPSPTPRTSSTSYDPYFHALPLQVDQPLGLTEQAGYDFAMGTMTAITDVNGSVTRASYDPLARLVAIARPGDTLQMPTVAMLYYDRQYLDYGKPFLYIVKQLELSGSTTAYRPLQSSYDGMGRLMQSKAESIDGAQNIVVNKAYNGLSQAVKESQPHYINETPSDTFWGYTPVTDTNGNIERWTTTAYEPLGRPSTTLAPDGTSTAMSYLVPAGGSGPATAVLDANGHKTQSYYDGFGRLAQVEEYTGTAGLSSLSVYATTVYTYSPLDLLTNVTDF